MAQTGSNGSQTAPIGGLLYDNADFEASELFHGQPVIRSGKQKKSSKTTNLSTSKSTNKPRKKRGRYHKTIQTPKRNIDDGNSDDDPTFDPNFGFDSDLEEGCRRRKPRLRKRDINVDVKRFDAERGIFYKPNTAEVGGFIILRGQPSVSNVRDVGLNKQSESQQYHSSDDGVLACGLTSTESVKQSLDDDNIDICGGQPVLKPTAFCYEENVHSQNKFVKEKTNEKDEFVAHIGNIVKLYSIASHGGLKIYRKVQELDKLYIKQYNQIGATKNFKETSHIETFVESNYVAVEIQQQTGDVVQLVSPDFNPDLPRKLELSRGIHTRGKCKSKSDESLDNEGQASDVLRINSFKRCRPRKASLQTLYEEHVTLSTYSQRSTCVAFKQLIQKLLVAITDPECLSLHSQDNSCEVAIILNKLKKRLINGILVSQEFLDEVERRPCMFQRAGGGGNLCEALQDNCDVIADRIVTLSGSPYSTNTLLQEQDEPDQKYFVSNQFGDKCKAYHTLHHYKYHLFEHCKDKYNNITREKVVTIPQVHDDHLHVTVDHDSCEESPPQQKCCKDHVDEEKIIIPSATITSNQMVKNTPNEENTKHSADIHVAETIDPSKPKADRCSGIRSRVYECLEDDAWVNKLYNHWIGIFTWISQILQEDKLRTYYDF
nr:uncharacterized protein LOC100184794 isoform X1 [Ciona intestinalis]|eukprot:XP_018666822.1 uncharacterized protein LOC100184794 isoform X1 [Ciona intestinalis]